MVSASSAVPTQRDRCLDDNQCADHTELDSQDDIGLVWSQARNNW